MAAPNHSKPGYLIKSVFKSWQKTAICPCVNRLGFQIADSKSSQYQTPLWKLEQYSNDGLKYPTTNWKPDIIKIRCKILDNIGNKISPHKNKMRKPWTSVIWNLDCEIRNPVAQPFENQANWCHLVKTYLFWTSSV